ncbi:MAG: hypothetical protein V1846_00015 [Candidatus Komeilibacteria bacterium]
MKKIIYILALMLVLGLTYCLGYWINSGDQRASLKDHQALANKIEDRLTHIISNPHCQYGINNPPTEGSIPECSNLMFWLDNGRNMALHFARTEYINYSLAQGLDIIYVTKQLNNLFAEKQFIVDQNNTRVTSLWSEDYKKHSFAYTQGDLKCFWSVVSVNDVGISDMSPPSIQMGCGQITDEDRQIYEDFLPIINSGNLVGEPFWLTAKEEGYASVSVGSVSSVYFLAKKVNGVWTAPLAPSQEYPMCSDVDRLGFPRSIYRNCMLNDYSLREPID